MVGNKFTDITFNALADGTYDNCKISVTDNATNTSDNLTVSEFTIGATKPALAEVTAVPNPTNDNTSNYTFFSTLPGTIGYGGSCTSDNDTAAVADNNTITFNVTGGGEALRQLHNCKISVTSSGGVESDNLSVSSFTIDITAPTLAETTLVPSLTNDNVTQYTFSSTEGGTITIGGHCSNGSDNNTAVADNMTVSFAALADGTYSNCTITVTDSAGNTVTIDVNPFTIDTTAPILAEVIAVPNRTNSDNASYTFHSDEIGTITYGGDCSSSSNDNKSVVGNNNIIFNALAEGGTYNNCKISVTDNASNTSDNLSVSSFTIDKTAPTVTEVTAVRTPDNDTTPDYTFYSTEAGTITYGGSCSSSDNNTTTEADNITTITFNTLLDNSSNSGGIPGTTYGTTARSGLLTMQATRAAP